MASEREQIARYLRKQVHDLYLRHELEFVKGVAWAIDRIVGEVAECSCEPKPTESLDEFLERKGDGEAGLRTIVSFDDGGFTVSWNV